MSNRINPMDQGLLGKIGNKVGDTGTTKSVDATKPAAGQGTNASQPSGDTVELTSSAKLLERLEKTLAGLPDVDRARVDVVKAQIENGDYKIDAGKISEAMMRLDQEIGRRQ